MKEVLVCGSIAPRTSHANEGTMPSMNGERAAHALDGLSVGDAFGQRFFRGGIELIASRGMQPRPGAGQTIPRWR